MGGGTLDRPRGEPSPKLPEPESSVNLRGLQERPPYTAGRRLPTSVARSKA